MTLANIVYRIATDPSFAEQILAIPDPGSIDELRHLPQDDLEALKTFMASHRSFPLMEFQIKAGYGPDGEPWWIP